MDADANVGLVDAHPKGDGGDDNVNVPREETAVHAGPLVAVELAVVKRDPGPGEPLGELCAHRLGVRGGRAVHDGRRRGAREGPAGPQQLDDRVEGGPPRGAAGHGDGKVGLVKRLERDKGRAKGQGPGNVLADPGHGRGGQRHDGNRGQGRVRSDLAQPAVLGAKVHPPLGHAMGLVHSDEREPPNLLAERRQPVHEAILKHLFGGHVHEQKVPSKGPDFIVGTGHRGAERNFCMELNEREK